MTQTVPRGVTSARELRGQRFHSCRSGNNASLSTPCCPTMELCQVPIPELSGLAKAWTLKTDCCLSLSVHKAVRPFAALHFSQEFVCCTLRFSLPPSVWSGRWFCTRIRMADTDDGWRMTDTDGGYGWRVSKKKKIENGFFFNFFFFCLFVFRFFFSFSVQFPAKEAFLCEVCLRFTDFLNCHTRWNHRGNRKT